MCNALGIVNFPGSNVKVKGLQDFRPVAAFSFLGRYRLVDFPLSNMSNSGIENIHIHLKNRPRSVISHVGLGRQYNLNPKRGGISILYGENFPESEFYNTDVASFRANLRDLNKSKKDYVVIAPSYMVCSIDYSKVVDAHIASGADVTVVYKAVDNAKERFIDCNTVEINRQKGILKIEKNRGAQQERNVSLDTYVLSKKLFLELIEAAAEISALYWFVDVINDKCNELDIRGYEYTGYLAAITDLTSYYNTNMELIDPVVAEELFKEEWPILTRTNDSAPSMYVKGSKVARSVVSNGCHIEGEVENSIVGRGCTIKKGAVVKNTVLMPGVVVGENAVLDNVVVDKDVTITEVKTVQGVCGSPAYVRRGDRI